MKHIEEDFERLSMLDKMYLIEHEQEMINEWQQWEEENSKLPAKIIIKESKNGRVKKSVKSIER